MASDSRKKQASAGVSQALERLCDTHAGIRLAPAVQQLHQQVKALQERMDSLVRVNEERGRVLQDGLQASWRAVDKKFSEKYEILEPRVALLEETRIAAQEKTDEKIGKLADHITACVEMMETRLEEQATVVKECERRSANAAQSVAQLEERTDTFRVAAVETTARVQKVEAICSQSEKMQRRLMELAEELEPFSRELVKVKAACEELKVSQGESSDAIKTTKSEVSDALATIANLTELAKPIPELQKSLAKLQLEQGEAAERFKQLALSAASMLDDQRAEKASAKERWQQLDETLHALVKEIANTKKFEPAIKELKLLVDSKCDNARIEEMAEIVGVQQGELDNCSRSVKKFRKDIETDLKEEQREIKVAVAGAITKITDLEQDLEDKVNKTAFQQVKTTLVNMSTQLNELKREQDGTAAPAKSAEGDAVPAGTLQLVHAKLDQFEEALHTKANRTEVNDLNVAMNKAQRKIASTEENVTRITSRVDEAEASLLRFNSSLDTSSARTSQVESTLNAVGRRVTDLQQQFAAKAEGEDVKEVVNAVSDVQSRVVSVQRLAEQLDVEVKAKASTAQLQTLAQTMGSLTAKFSEQGRELVETTSQAQEALTAALQAQQQVQGKAADALVQQLAQDVEQVSVRIKGFDETVRRQADSLAEATNSKCAALGTKMAEVAYALNSKVDLKYFESVLQGQGGLASPPGGSPAGMAAARPAPPAAAFQPPAREGS